MAYSRSLVIPRIAVGGDGALTVRDTAFLQAAELQVSGDLVLRAGTFLIDSGSEETRGLEVLKGVVEPSVLASASTMQRQDYALATKPATSPTSPT